MVCLTESTCQPKSTFWVVHEPSPFFSFLTDVGSLRFVSCSLGCEKT